LEQGFTLQQPLAGMQAEQNEQWLELHLALNGATADASNQGWVTIHQPDGQTVRYGELYSYDANGKVLPGQILTGQNGQELRLRVNLAGASYPVVIDPLVQQQKLIMHEGAAGDLFGRSVALSADGNTALIGAANDNVAGNPSRGSAFIFRRVGTTWTFQTQLTADDGFNGDNFGIAVDVSADGNTALVGAWGDDVGNNSDQGSAYVLTYNGTSWSQQQKLVAPDGTFGDSFGNAVTLSADGNTALIGAYTDDVGVNTDQGSAYIFTRTNTTWTFQTQITATNGAGGDNFGNAVALSADGNSAIISAWKDDVNGKLNQGSAYIYIRGNSANIWSFQTQFVADNGAVDDVFGTAVALSANGNTALIGAIGYDGANLTDQGAAYVFTRNDVTWSSPTQITATNGAAGDYFGYDVALSGDGNTALIGANNDDVGLAVNVGSAYIFARTSNISWTFQTQITAATGGASDRFGGAVALSGDGNTALSGAWEDDVNLNTDQGSAYVFVRSIFNWTFETQLTANEGAPSDTFGRAVALSADGNTALIGSPDDDLYGNANQGSVYIFVRNSGLWTYQAKFSANDGAAEDNFGLAVALSADGNTALVGAYFDDIGNKFNQGSAYIFTRTGRSWLQQKKLIAPDGVGLAQFGNAVSLSADGSTALIGAWTDTIGATPFQGSAYIFSGSGADWTFQTKLTAANGAFDDKFGNAVALSADGNTALIGAFTDDVGANSNQGSAYVFTRTNTISWTFQTQLTITDGATNDVFGIAVALSADGNTALIGAYGDDVNGVTDQGSAYVFTRSGSSWGQPIQLVANNPAVSDAFGYALALSAKGDIAVVGAYDDDVSGKSNQGSGYAFIRDGEGWAFHTQFTASDGITGDNFARAIALSADGSTVLAGAWYDDVNGVTDQGSAYVFNVVLPVIQFSSSSYQINENGGTASITLNRSGSSSGVVSVTVAITNGTATEADYTAPLTVTVSWANGDTSSKTVTIPIVDDSLDEDNETVLLSLLSTQGGALLGTPNQATLTIVDNDKAGTTTMLTSAPNPSDFGQSVTFTATVSAVAPATGTPSGTVTFKEGATTLGSGTLDGTGVATFTTSSLSVGDHIIVAQYGGDANFNGSISSPITQVVRSVCDPLVVTSTADDGNCGTLRVAANTATSGQSITVTLAAGSTISLTTGITLSNGVTLTTNTGCGLAGPEITVQGGTGDGLTLSGNNTVAGLWIRGFSGRQVVASSTGNGKTVLQCVRATKN
jgi:hypothetical protein